MKIKKSLLEYLVRECIHEIMTQVKEVDDTKGAPAPPADGTGSGENLGLPGEDPAASPEGGTEMKGIVLVNPKKTGNLRKVPVTPEMDDHTIERTVRQMTSSMASSRVKIAQVTKDAIRDTLKNPSGSLYLYFGKFDPASSEVWLLANKSVQIARQESKYGVEVGTPVSMAPIAPPSEPEVAPVAEELKKAIKDMVSEVLSPK